MVRRLAFAVLINLSSLSSFADEEGPMPIDLRLDHAQLVRLPEGTSTVVLGNPKIADITPQRTGFYVLTGKAFGSTNLIAQSNDGQVLAAFVLRVIPNIDTKQMVVQRGMAQETLHCIPRCLPTDNAAAAAPTPAATR